MVKQWHSAKTETAKATVVVVVVVEGLTYGNNNHPGEIKLCLKGAIELLVRKSLWPLTASSKHQEHVLARQSWQLFKSALYRYTLLIIGFLFFSVLISADHFNWPPSVAAAVVTTLHHRPLFLELFYVCCPFHAPFVAEWQRKQLVDSCRWEGRQAEVVRSTTTVTVQEKKYVKGFGHWKITVDWTRLTKW